MNHEMKLGLQNYAIIIPTDKSYVKFNNNKINSSQIHMQFHKITEFYTNKFSVCPNITSKFRITAVFKSCVKENNDSNETCRYDHYLSLGETSLSKCNGS
jgi:predicted component of viral defense system (DUF524 family)